MEVRFWIPIRISGIPQKFPRFRNPDSWPYMGRPLSRTYYQPQKDRTTRLQLNFYENPASCTFFLWLSRIPFFFSPKYIRWKRLIAVEANKCKMQMRLIFWIYVNFKAIAKKKCFPHLSMTKRRGKGGRKEEGERRVSSPSLPTPHPLGAFSCMLTILCAAPLSERLENSAAGNNVTTVLFSIACLICICRQ